LPLFASYVNLEKLRGIWQLRQARVQQTEIVPAHPHLSTAPHVWRRNQVLTKDQMIHHSWHEPVGDRFDFCTVNALSLCWFVEHIIIVKKTWLI
jgi:hypothetical protein